MIKFIAMLIGVVGLIAAFISAQSGPILSTYGPLHTINENSWWIVGVSIALIAFAIVPSIQWVLIIGVVALIIMWLVVHGI